jgi:hypothetical protein
VVIRGFIGKELKELPNVLIEVTVKTPLVTEPVNNTELIY